MTSEFVNRSRIRLFLAFHLMTIIAF